LICVKVIISTKIAESSITVPDIKYVIDFCLTKELYCDPATNYTHLRVEWASKANLDQRSGRAGRVSDGICYRLITRQFYQELADYSTPAILREPLDKVILNVKRLKQPGEPRKILSLALQPPKLTDIDRTLLNLKEVGALTLKTKASLVSDKFTPNDGDLTYVGFVMSSLPIDVHMTKLILLGHVFGKLRDAIVIAAGLSNKVILKNMFIINYIHSGNN
jgi:ATP-dependent RNA helicase TDRD9